MKRQYRVKVTEMHIDYVWIEAESRSQAESQAHEHSQCEYNSLHECLVVEEAPTYEELTERNRLKS